MVQKNAQRFPHKRIYDLLWRKNNRLKLENAYGSKLTFFVNPVWEDNHLKHIVVIRKFLYAPPIAEIVAASETEVKLISKSAWKPEVKKALEEILKSLTKNSKVLLVFETKS